MQGLLVSLLYALSIAEYTRSIGVIVLYLIYSIYIYIYKVELCYCSIPFEYFDLSYQHKFSNTIIIIEHANNKQTYCDLSYQYNSSNTISCIEHAINKHAYCDLSYQYMFSNTSYF